MGKRIRNPSHYIAGLGDGNVKVRGDRRDNPANAANLRRPQPMQQDHKDDASVPSRAHDTTSSQIDDTKLPPNKDNYVYASDRWDAYFHDGTSRVNGYNSRVRPTDPWQFSAFALLASVVLMSALFLHLISDSSGKEKKSLRRRHKPPNRIHKKTDEWIDDDDEDQEIADSSQQSKSTPGKQVQLPRPPNVYYHPYQPRLQQRLPQRKLTPTDIPVPSTTSAGAPVINSPLDQSFGEPFVTGSSYMNPSGGRILYRAPSSRTASRYMVPSSPKPSPRLSPRPSPKVSPKASPSVIRQVSYSVASPAPLYRIQGDGTSHYETPPMPCLSLQQSGPRAVAIESRVSSFGSLIENDSSQRNLSSDASKSTHYLDEETGTPKRFKDTDGIDLSQSSESSGILLSPGTEDIDETLRLTGRTQRKIKEIPGVADETPRVTNGRKTWSPKATFECSRIDEWHEASLQPLSTASSSMAFAAPRARRRPLGNDESDELETEPTNLDIPYVPSLTALRRNEKPPMSVNVDELQLHQMESGNVSHWEARVAEESQILQERVFSGPTYELFDDYATNDKIPSDDPRAGIDHKRKSLIQDTNSAASLQGAIDFSRLELIEVIGGGGFGQVWKAKWRGTPVAVKVLTGSAQQKNVPKPVLEEFAAEINLLKGMQHPNICLYMGACIDPPNRAIVTELAANGSLWDALRLPLNQPFVCCDGKTLSGWPLALWAPDPQHGAPPAFRVQQVQSLIPPKYIWPWVLIKKVAVGVARGMAYLHGGEPPVLHRDLKSANILLDESYNPKVCDFGLSRLKAQERSMTGNCGTVQWMAPEVLANQSYNEKADVFSYGIICWELLTRQCPYDGMTAIQCALAVLNRNQRPEIPKWCPPALHAVIRSCVKKNPDERPTFEQLIRDFDSLPDA